MEKALDIKNFRELNENQHRQGVEIFVDEYYRQLEFLSRESELLVDLLEHSFLKEYHYAALLDEVVVGIGAVSTQQSRPYCFNRKTFVSELGLWRGYFGYQRLRNELEKPLELKPEQCFIEGVVTDVAFRGKGVATTLQHYMFEELPYKEYLLAIDVYNNEALDYYGKFGFAPIETAEYTLPMSFFAKRESLILHMCSD